MKKLLFYYVLAGSTFNAPALTNYRGKSGRDFKFFWNQELKKHVLEKRSLTPEEFTEIGKHLFSGTDQSWNAHFAIPLVLTEEVVDDTNSTSPVIPASHAVFASLMELGVVLHAKHEDYRARAEKAERQVTSKNNLIAALEKQIAAHGKPPKQSRRSQRETASV